MSPTTETSYVNGWGLLWTIIIPHSPKYESALTAQWKRNRSRYSTCRFNILISPNTGLSDSGLVLMTDKRLKTCRIAPDIKAHVQNE